MSGPGNITQLEILVRRIDELEEQYALTLNERDKDIRDDLISAYIQQIAMLSGLLFDLAVQYRISKAEIEKLLGRKKGDGDGD